VTWDWGQFQLGDWSLIYGGVNRDTVAGAPASGSEARFLFAVDGRGLAGVLPIRSVEYALDASGRPRSMELEAARGEHVVRLRARAGHVRVTEAGGRADRTDLFFQARGPARVEGRLPTGEISATGDGFFETWQRRPRKAR